jgi:flavin-dependent thymidylate synthase
MQRVKMGFEIMRFPDGEEALAFLERVCREAYASEERIDDGKEECPDCRGAGYLDYEHLGHADCSCSQKGWIQAREPSSHKLLRKVLKLNRRERLATKVGRMIYGFTHHDYEGQYGNADELAQRIVNIVLDDYRDDPPHTSVLDHLQATVRVLASRGVSHEWVRHRIGWGYLQRSTRLCGGGERLTEEGIQVIDRDIDHFTHGAKVCGDRGEQARITWIHGLDRAEMSYRALLRHEKPQIAREVLPIGVYAPLIATGTLSAWHHFFRLRLGPKAHPDMHRIAKPLLKEFQRRIPIVFDVPGLI